jgi:ABC-2 type transport system permease protein
VKNFAKMFLYELRMTFREREAIFWMFMFPIALMLILGFVFGSSGNMKLGVGVVDLDNSPVSRAIVEGLSGIDALEVHEGDEAEERAQLQDDKRNAVIIINEGFGERVLRGQAGELVMIINQSDVTTAQITSSTVRGIIDQIGRSMAGTPELVSIGEEVAENVKDFRYVDFMVPGVVSLVLMFGGLMGFSEMLAVRREKGILRRVKVSPISLPRFLGSGMASVVVLALIQTTILMLVGWLVFRIRINGDFFNIAVTVIIGSLSFVALGFMISSLTKTSKSALLAGNAITMPMMFLSGLFFSVEWVPKALKVIARCLPLYYLGDAMRGVMIDAASLADIWLDLVVLIAMGLVCFAVAVRFFRWE